MWIISMIIFIINGALCLFSLNLVVKQKKRWYIIHSVVFFVISMVSVYLYMNEYLIEAFITFFIIGGVEVVVDDKLLPKIIKEKNDLLTHFVIYSLVICLSIFIFI